ncbi:MAG: hypothetical protein EB078_10730, partial [Proteobacteria bacterium]|nr:hypothetical protein [Pseudomonadota bacterium]
MLSFRSVFTPVKLLMRYQSIVWTLTRYGIAGSLTSLGMEFGKRGIRWISPQAMSVNEFDEVFGRNLAITFEKLGPTFIKLGQVLASRPDFVGEKVAQELQVLFSKVRPI